MSEPQPQHKAPLKVVFCWHMHQPDYRDYQNGQYQLPWTYLHAIKDYVDMVAHLEQIPQARVVVNFSPVLLQQIDDYSEQIRRYFSDNETIRDSLLSALVTPALPANIEYRQALVKSCLRANEQHLIRRFKPYDRLVTLGEYLKTNPDHIRYLSSQYLADLLMWYHLAWLGETVRMEDARVIRLIAKERDYTLHDRRQLLSIIGELLSALIGRYRHLAENGQIELSLSPYAHPIIPLLLDMGCARQSMPDIVMPVTEQYPGGLERAQWQLQQGLETFEHYFGHRPAGCWLSEGGVSESALGLLAQYGLKWTASGEGVLRNSLKSPANTTLADKHQFLYRGYRIQDYEITCFFRDDELSDLIGFTYFDWHGDDAVANMIHRLEGIAQQPEVEPGSVVSIILDGENAWEHYPQNAYHFVRSLYRAIAEHPALELATFSDCLSPPVSSAHLDQLVAGSWVYGTFSTWIGDEQKNRGWDMLIDAKRCFDRVVAGGQLSEAQHKLAQIQLAICESSDWFWWFGDYNPADTVSDFERLYRIHLANLYQCLRQEPPDYLTRSFTRGGGNPVHGGVMRVGKA